MQTPTFLSARSELVAVVAAVDAAAAAVDVAAVAVAVEPELHPTSMEAVKAAVAMRLNTFFIGFLSSCECEANRFAHFRYLNDRGYKKIKTEKILLSIFDFL